MNRTRKHVTVIILLALTVTITGVADSVVEFKNWDDLIRSSPDIFIAKRTDPFPTTWTNAPMEIIHPSAPCTVEIVSVLKGDARLGPAELWLPYDPIDGILPRRGEIFLTFTGKVVNGTNVLYGAVESYRTVTITQAVFSNAWTNALAEKPLKEQIKRILISRRSVLNGELERDKAESNRLEQGIEELK